ncbi:hypothetical protein L484_000938 [Morus notabilis]|uniref:Uncharacterized protein n=1 Tax=Morus notabilis TaxID=981085 RepID=W9RVF9_9ROSA|nr:hypothetical protein L484_000938 [Morus notabilis]
MSPTNESPTMVPLYRPNHIAAISTSAHLDVCPYKTMAVICICADPIGCPPLICLTVVPVT